MSSLWKSLDGTNTFIQEMLRIIPAEQHPDDLVFPDESPIFRQGNLFCAPTKAIRIHKESEWRAAEKYRGRLEVLEKRVATLELKP